MKSVIHRLAVVICLLVATSAANATLISFDPADTTADMGALIAVDIIATPEMGELIGAFDFIVNFDPAVLAFNDLIFGPALNSDPFFCALLGCRGFVAGAGTLEMFETSLEFFLGLLQDGTSPVVLGTIFFDAIGVGTSGLSFTGNILGQDPPFNILGDEFGLPLAVLQPGVGSVTVIQVPEPSSLLLMLTGLALIAGRRIKL